MYFRLDDCKLKCSTEFWSVIRMTTKRTLLTIGQHETIVQSAFSCHMQMIFWWSGHWTSGRWQAPAAVLPPEGWQRGRGPEGPEDKGHGHSRARRAREWPKHASPRARRARGRAKLSARLGACQCYYMFFTTQLKIAKFMGHSQDLNVGQKS